MIGNLSMSKFVLIKRLPCKTQVKITARIEVIKSGFAIQETIQDNMQVVDYLR